MKKTLAAITTAILAVGIVVAGVSGAASADDTDATSAVATTDTSAAADAGSATDSSAGPSIEDSATTAADESSAPVPASAPEPAVVSDESAMDESTPSSTNGSATKTTSSTGESPTCVSDPTFSYTYKIDKGSVTAVKEGVAEGTPLCKPIYLRAATWSYDLPTTGQNPSWPQTLVGTDDVVLDHIGTVLFQAPEVATCKQNDVYASFDGWEALKLPSKLVSPAKPFEPGFLQSVFGVEVGPWPTSYTTPSADCAPATDAVQPVTFTDVCGTAGDKVNIPTDTVGYTYKTDDDRDDNGVGTVTVTAVADDQHKLPEAQTSWSHTFLSDAGNNCVKLEGDPTVTPQVCDSSQPNGIAQGVITVVGTDHISYVIHNTDVPSRNADVTVLDGPTALPVGNYDVTAIPDEGFTLTDVPATTVHEILNQAVDCELTTEAAFTPSASSTDQVCSAGNTTSGSIRIDPADGLTYFVGSRQLTSATTSFAPGTYSVRAEAPAGDSIVGTNPISLTIAAAAASCGGFAELTTLAFTGVGSGTAMFLIIAAILLLIGAALISGRKIRSSRNSTIN